MVIFLDCLFHTILLKTFSKNYTTKPAFMQKTLMFIGLQISMLSN